MGKARKAKRAAKQEAEQFAQQWSISDPAFAAWWMGNDGSEEVVTAAAVMGLSAMQRGVNVVSTTIASLPLRTYERQGDEKVRVDSVFDDPYPGPDGMTVFQWVETILIHLMLWRNAYLWHEASSGPFITAYRPVLPDLITFERKGGRSIFKYTENGDKKEVGSETITHIAGPAMDGFVGTSILNLCRSVFSGAISGDRTAATTLRRGIRLAGLVTPEEGGEFEPAEGDAILESLRATVVGREHAGDIALVNKRLKLQNWAATNIELQWAETRSMMLGEVERITGVHPALMFDIEKQTSWGTGVAEQNLAFARFTLMGWTSRIEQVLTRHLPEGQFVEFDYKGLLQGTPEKEIRLVLDEIERGLITIDEGRQILNLPPRTPAEIAATPAPTPAPRPTLIPQEATA